MSCSLWSVNHQSAPIKNCDRLPLNANDHLLFRICEYTKPYFQVSKYLSVIISISYYVGWPGPVRTDNLLINSQMQNYQLCYRPMLVAGVGFEPTYSVLMRQASSSTLPGVNLWRCILSLCTNRLYILLNFFL